MRKIVLALVLAFVVVSAFSISATAQEGTKRSRAMKAMWDKLSEQKKERALAKAQKHKMFSKCTYFGNGTVASRFVKFHYVESSGLVHDLSIRTDRNASANFFKEIKPLPFNSTSKPYLTGAVFHHEATDLMVRGHCNPTAVFGWLNGNGTRTITFTLGDNATVGNATTKEVRVNVGSIHGHIVTNANGTLLVVGKNVTGTLTKGDKVMFRAHPAMGVANRLHDQIRAFKTGKLGAIVNVVDQDGTPVQESEDVDVETESQEISHGHLKLVARGTVSGNRVLYIVVDSETFDVKAKIMVKVGGQVATNATSAAELENATAAAASVTQVDEAVEIAVNVPHFSDQTIEIQQEGGASGTDGATGKRERGTPGFELVAVLGALAALVVALRRR